MATTPHMQPKQTQVDPPLSGPNLFGGIMLLVSGPLSILLGTTGIARDHLFSSVGYAYHFNLTAWGWIHLVMGVLLVAAGVAVLSGRSWGHWAGLTTAGVSLVTQFMFLPYYPAWAITIMTIDAFILWSLSRFQN